LCNAKKKIFIIITSILFAVVVAIIGFRTQGTSEVTSTKASGAATEQEAGSKAEGMNMARKNPILTDR